MAVLTGKRVLELLGYSETATRLIVNSPPRSPGVVVAGRVCKFKVMAETP